MNSKGLIVGVDASRNRSGGAKAHLIGILSELNPTEYGINQVHVWSYLGLLKVLPEKPWLIKHNPPELEQSLARQLWWQVFKLPGEFKECGCDVMLNTDAGTVSRIRPSVTMSRDMLSYEPGEMERYGFSKARLRLQLLRCVQNRSLRNSDGVIFLTRYAADVIQSSCGALENVAHIPHGVGKNFVTVSGKRKNLIQIGKPIKCLYISNIALYKHQWHVVKAVEMLRTRGLDIHLTLAGGGKGRAQERLAEQLRQSDPGGHFVKQKGYVPQADLPRYLSEADIFVFASSCENMPNTLLEAMASGIPIACSNRGPMPEVLKDGGIYFDPEQPDSISKALSKLIENPALRQVLAERARCIAERYSWTRCARETWEFVSQIYAKVNKPYVLG